MIWVQTPTCLRVHINWIPQELQLAKIAQNNVSIKFRFFLGGQCLSFLFWVWTTDASYNLPL